MIKRREEKMRKTKINTEEKIRENVNRQNMPTQSIELLVYKKRCNLRKNDTR